MKRSKIFGLVLVVLSLFVATSCDKKEKIGDVATGTDEPVSVEEKKVTIIDLESNTRPIAITINNFPSAVKVQAGLSEAYMVYEIPVEGGMSRSIAFYKDKYPERVGTVRSARHNMLDYVMENDAIFAHYGWSFYARDQIPQLGINNLDGNSSDPAPFWRENPEKLAWEHTVYGSISKVRDTAKAKGYSMTTTSSVPLKYTTDVVDLSAKEGNMNANLVRILYSNSFYVDFRYNSEAQRYYRYVNNVAHTDYFTKEHYSAKNIIVVKMGVGYASNGYYLDLKNVGTGEGYYITNGKAMPITWQKDSRSAQTIYKYKDGTEVNVNDGNTYVMVQSSSYGTTIE